MANWWKHLRKKRTDDEWKSLTNARTYHAFKCMDVWEESLSPLLRACRDGDRKLCAILLETDFAASFSLDAMGGNAVYWAVVSASKVMLNDIIMGGLVETTMKTIAGESPLHVACELGHTNLIELLAYCNPFERTSNGEDCFDLVAMNGDTSCCKELMRLFPNSPSGSQLPMCAARGHLMYMRFLLETVHLSVDSTNIYGETALYKAYENGFDDLILLLYDHGANPFILTGTGANLLHAAAAATGDRVEAIEDLIRRFRDDGTLATALNVKHRYVPGEDYYIVTGMDKGRAAWHYIHWHRL
jgi:ankyrin repeat protein